MTPEEFKAIREQLGLTPTEFGRKLGYENPYLRVTELENGKRPVSNQIKVICELVLKVDELEKEISRLKGN